MSKAFSITQALAVPSNVALLRKHNVIYLDRGLIAINKPAGLVTQGTVDGLKKEGTIQMAIDDIRTALNMKEGPYTVHRLDKPTTGLYMLATTPTQAKTLSQAFMPSDPTSSHSKAPTNKALKRYLALVHTSPHSQKFLSMPGSSELQVGYKRTIELDLYINREGLVSLWADVVKRLRHGDLENALKRKRVAVSELEVLGISSKYPVALVGLQLLTGIKHQLRVSLASYCKAPILGDTKYGTFEQALPAKLFPPDKLMLHSSTLQLTRFHNKRPFSFEISAPPPKEFINACKEAEIVLPMGLKDRGVLYDGADVRERLRRWENGSELKDGLEGGMGEEFTGLEGAWLATL